MATRKSVNAKYGDRHLETIVKGAGSHRRVQFLALLHGQPNLTVKEAAGAVRIDIRTASEHLRKMTAAGLVYKTHDGRSVRLALSPRGVAFLRFLREIK